MSFGLMLQSLPFVLFGFALFAAMFVATVFTFLVGRAKSGIIARRYLQNVGRIFVILLVLIFIYAWLSGQIHTLTELYGSAALFELLTFGFIWVGIVWFLGSAYANSKAQKEEEASERALQKPLDEEESKAQESNTQGESSLSLEGEE